MKITRLKTRVVTRISEHLQWNPRTSWREKNALLVELETEAGLTGIGEAWCEGLSPAATISLLEQDLAPRMVGADPRMIGEIWSQLFELTVVSAKPGLVFAALSAIDIALWDLLGQIAHLPVYKLLGGARDRVLAYASGGLYAKGKTPDDVAAEMAGYVAKGFRGVKLKIGGAPIKDDVARVRAVREAIGHDVRLMVDALYTYSVSESLRMARALEPFDVYFLEAPVSPYDVDGLGRVSTASPIPVAGNEFAYGRYMFRDIIERGRVAYVHLDTILCGGFSEGVRICALASARNLPCSFHASSSAVCFAANLHLAAAIPNCDSIEFHMVHQLLFDELAPGNFELHEGHIRLPQRPGLGLMFAAKTTASATSLA